MQVDLAGSERIKESGSEGVRLTEAQVQLTLGNSETGKFKLIFFLHLFFIQAINKSLSNLGQVIMALAQKVDFSIFCLRKETFHSFIFFSVVPHSIPELQADPLAAEQPGRQLKDPDVR